MKKLLTKIILELDDENNLYFNDELIPSNYFMNKDFASLFGENFSIPDACKTCSNHPSNGGSGICHCILGSPKITC